MGVPRVMLAAALAAVVAMSLGSGVAGADQAEKATRPQVTSISVTSGPTTGGIKVTVRGSGFTDVKKVTFGSTRGRSLRVLSASKLTVVAPRHVIGRVAVHVATKAGRSTVTAHDQFDYRQYATIAAGTEHSCALSSGRVRCWGSNGEGRLGNGMTTDSLTPVAVKGLADPVAVSAGDADTCALLADGTVKCWGYNGSGDLGDGTTTNSSTPVRVKGLSHVVAISAGADVTCAVVDDGTVRCWGDNTFGALGDGTTGGLSAKPVRVSGLSHVTAISAGDSDACAVVAGGKVRCWGYGAFGALGDGGINDSSTPRRVIGLSHATSVSAGASDTCAVVAGGTVRCWGDHGDGALGNGTAAGSLTPVRVSGLTHVTGVSTGNGPTCAVASGSVFCWGIRTFGDLGDGSPASDALQLTPVAVVDLVGVTAISTGSQGSHTLARIPGKGIRAWGHNDFGQLGDDTTTDSPIPVTVK